MLFLGYYENAEAEQKLHLDTYTGTHQLTGEFTVGIDKM